MRWSSNWSARLPGRAEPVGPGRFRLSHLLRGRRGSEWAMAQHAVDERFVLLDPARLVRIPVPSEMMGAEVAVQAHGIGDSSAGPVDCAANGEAVRPPSPCRLSVAQRNGRLNIQWVRRSRLGWGWGDGPEAPIGEASEAYRVRIAGAGVERQWVTSEPLLDLFEIELAGFAPGPAIVAVAQLGDFGASHEVRTTINF